MAMSTPAARDGPCLPQAAPRRSDGGAITPERTRGISPSGAREKWTEERRAPQAQPAIAIAAAASGARREVHAVSVYVPLKTAGSASGRTRNSHVVRLE